MTTSTPQACGTGQGQFQAKGRPVLSLKDWLLGQQGQGLNPTDQIAHADLTLMGTVLVAAWVLR